IKPIKTDLHGTLIVTNEFFCQSFVLTFCYFGYSFSKEIILQFNGPPLIKTITQLNPNLADDIIKMYRKHNLKHHNDYVTLFPNVKETLDLLYENGKQLGIVSAKMRPGVELGLEVTGIKKYFKTIVSVDDIVNPKPHPEPVLKAMKNLQGEPNTSIMVGDNYHDIESGKNAGVQTVAVAWSVKGEEYLQQFKPTYMIEDMREILEVVGV